jgi:hypothetical protein
VKVPRRGGRRAEGPAGGGLSGEGASVPPAEDLDEQISSLRESVEVELREAGLPRRSRRPLVQPPTKATLGSAVTIASLLSLVAVALWAASLPGVDVSRMSDIGLVSVLPPAMFVSIAMLTISFCISLRELPRGKWLVLLNVVVLVIIVAATAALVEPEPRTVAVWRHVGVIESISRNGQVDPHIDAYFNWPGFFILGAFIGDVAGVKSAIVFADWAPLLFNFLYLGPLLMLFRSATKDERVVWLAIWFFYSTNWVNQDYFSPQAFGFFLYIAALAVIVRWFSATQSAGKRRRLWRDRLGLHWGRFAGRVPVTASEATPTPDPELSARQRMALIGLTVILVAAIVPSHQLTPFAMLTSLAALVAFNRTSARMLPVLTAVLIGTWMVFMAASYLAGHIDVLTGHVGRLEDTVQANVGAHIGGSPEHRLVVNSRLALTAVVWGLALLGAILAFRARRLQVTFGLLAVAPFGLVALQPYGGEVLLRVYFFSLPFVAFFAASAFFSGRGSNRSWPRVVVICGASLALLAALPLARYGNERMDFFTADETRAVYRLYDVAPPGSLLVAGSRNVPWKFEGYEEFDYLVVAETDLWAQTEASGGDIGNVVASLESQMRARGRGRAYLIITRSEKVYLDLLGFAPRGALDRFERAVVSSGQFSQIFGNRDAKVFVVAQQRGPST